MDDTLNKAIDLIRSGQKEQARPILEALIKRDSQNLPAWFWYAETYKTIPEQIQILETCLRTNPENPQVLQALDTLRTKQFKPAKHAQVSKRPVSPKTPLEEEDNQPPDSQEEKVPSPGRQPQGGTLTRGMWVLSILLISFVAAGGVYLLNTMPPSPEEHFYSEPSEYYLYAPRAYTNNREWPVFVGIHGSGGSGRNCWNWWQSYADREGFILVCPSFADAGGGWVQSEGERQLLDILNQVAGQYQTESQVYLAGFSAGAMYAQGYTFHYPSYVKGVAVLSPGQYLPPIQSARGIPFLVSIGELDVEGRLIATREFVSALEQNGFDIEYHTIPGVGHTLSRQARNLTIEHFRKVYEE